MMMLADRTEATNLPTVQEIFARSDELDGDFARDLVDKIYFSTFPGAKEGGAAAIRAFLTNDANMRVLKSTGAVGAVIEMFHRIGKGKNANTAHGRNLLPTLHILAIGDDAVQKKMLANTHTLPILLNVIATTKGSTQVMAFEILNEMSYLEGGLDKIIELNVLDLLFSCDVMYRPATDKQVRHMAVVMVHRITTRDPSLFPVHHFEDVVLDPATQRRRIDGYMEISLLNSLLIHLNWLGSKHQYLNQNLKLFRHFIGEVLHETFEDLDHMMRILDLICSQVGDIRQLEWLMECDLPSCLQLLVKTNYALLRRSTVALSQVKISSPQGKNGKKGKKDDRPLQTRMALALVRPQQSAATRTDDINFSTTQKAIEIYEALICHRPEIIANMVSSGLIPALLFRVGTGQETDWNFNRLVVNFMDTILMTVAQAQSDDDLLIGLIPTHGRLSFYATLAYEEDESKSAKKLVESLRAKVASYKDIRLVSNTLAAHGLVDVLLAALSRHEEPQMVACALRCLSLLKFSSFSSKMYNSDVLLRLVTMSMKTDFYYGAMSILTDACLSPDLSEDELDTLMKSQVLLVLIRALSTTGWMFKLKHRVYRAIAVLSQHKNFYNYLLDSEGMGILLTVLHKRKKALREKRRIGGGDKGDDDSTEQLLRKLRHDWAMSRIQSFVRVKRTKRIVAERRRLLEEEGSIDGI